MYAVFRSGGKQYRASEGERVRVERLDADEGDAVEFDQVLMVRDGADVTLGSPLVEDSRVQGVVTAQGRGKKITVTKFKRRKNYKRTLGHRQHFTEVEITSIGSGSSDAEAEAAEPDSAIEAEAVEQDSATQAEAGAAEADAGAVEAATAAEADAAEST